MIAQAARPPEKEHLAELPRVGIRQRQPEPAVWHLALQCAPVAMRLLPPLLPIAIIPYLDRLNLQLPSARKARDHDRFLTTGVVRELVSRDLPLSTTGATAPPEDIPALGAPL